MNLVYKALSDPTRRAILELLKDGDKSAGELAEQFEISRPAMTKHFQVLREANLVYSEKHGQQVIYSLKVSVLEEALMAFMNTMGIAPNTKR